MYDQNYLGKGNQTGREFLGSLKENSGKQTGIAATL